MSQQNLKLSDFAISLLLLLLPCMEWWKIVGADCPEIVSGKVTMHPVQIRYGSLRSTVNGNWSVIVCDPGHSLSVGGTEYQCDGVNGTWWPEIDAECEPDCQPIFGIAHGRVNGSSNSSVIKYRDQQDVTCDSGYTVNGPSRFVCEKNGLWDLNPSETTCEPDCPGIKDVTLVHISDPQKYSEKYSSGKEYNVECMNGTSLVVSSSSSATITCGPNGQWSPAIPVCQPDCNPVGPTRNGRVSRSGSTPIDSRVRVVCMDGFSISGTDKRFRNHVCRSDGQYDPPIESTQCSRDCDAQIPGVSLRPPRAKPGDWVKARCYNGGQVSPINAKKIQCSSNGSWSSSPACVIGGCIPMGASHGRTSTGLNIVPKGGRTVFSCELGYQLIGSESYECLEGNKWSPSHFTTRCIIPQTSTTPTPTTQEPLDETKHTVPKWKEALIWTGALIGILVGGGLLYFVMMLICNLAEVEQNMTEAGTKEVSTVTTKKANETFVDLEGDEDVV